MRRRPQAYGRLAVVALACLVGAACVGGDGGDEAGTAAENGEVAPGCDWRPDFGLCVDLLGRCMDENWGPRLEDFYQRLDELIPPADRPSNLGAALRELFHDPDGPVGQAIEQTNREAGLPTN